MIRSRGRRLFAAALVFAAVLEPGSPGASSGLAEAAVPWRLRSAAAPVPPSTAMAAPLPTPPPPALPQDAYPRISQGLTAETVRRVIWVHINQIRYCYQQALFKQPTLAGRMLVNFQINPQGQVLELSVRESTLESPQLIACVSDAMRAWEFPPTPSYDGITEINYPFLLRPRIPEPPAGIQVSDAELESIGIFKDPEPPPVDILF